MSERFQDKYRISSTRLQNWDYSWNAMYFVTINTHGQEKFFGEIERGEMYLTNLGTIADVLWYETKNHFNFVELDQFVVMPNHIHGILGIKRTEIFNAGKNHSESQFSEDDLERTPGKQRKGNQGKSTLSSVVGSYKSAVSKHAHRLNYRFAWQSRFYEQLIRDEKSLENVRNYITNNISNWNKNSFNKYGSYEGKC